MADGQIWAAIGQRLSDLLGEWIGTGLSRSSPPVLAAHFFELSSPVTRLCSAYIDDDVVDSARLEHPRYWLTAPQMHLFT